VFRPTSRVALLGAWVHPDLFRNGSLLPMMDSLHEQAGFGVALGSMVGASLKHIHTVGALPDELSSGAERHLLHSPFGHVILSTMFSRDVRLLVHRLNAESSAEDQVRYGTLETRITEVSKKRSAMGLVAPGWSGIAVLLPQGMGEEQLAVGVVGPTADIEARSEELLRTIRQAISTHVGPRVASANEAIYPVLRQGGEKA
jgi:IclR family acetate operon transcriptional repressor